MSEKRGGMKFRLLSDIHLEFNSVDKAVKLLTEVEPVDYLILAGDIVTVKTSHLLIELIGKVAPFYKKIVYITGNHEVYGSDKEIDVLLFYRELVKNMNISIDNKLIMLEDECVVLDGITIIGSTLWTDITSAGYRAMNDKRFLSHEWILNKHHTSKEAIHRLINESSSPIIVVTHHLPSFAFIAKKYEGYENSGFASNCEDLYNERVKIWAFGHTHTPIDTTHEIGTRFLCNPVGYPEERNVVKDVTFEV